MRRGLIHIYTGNGKGKTTACIGLAVRMTGSGGKVLYAFMQKGRRSSEIAVLEAMENVDVFRICTIKKFSFQLNETEKIEYRRQHEEGLKKIMELYRSEKYDMVVVDELLGAIQEKAIVLADVLDFLKNKPKECEIIITGRQAPVELIAIADYVSEIKEIKHPYNNGVSARKGIEF